MEFNEVIKKRSATRKFSDKKVPREIIDQILEAGNLAPTAKNQQPQFIYVVESYEGLSKIDMVSPCRYNAQCCLIVCGNKDLAFTKNNHSTLEVDVSIVATHMILSAANLGVDSTWIAMFDEEKTKEIFELDNNLEPVCIINLGYKTEDCPLNINHNIRKDINSLVKFI